MNSPRERTETTSGNRSDEPMSGVAALFDADTHTTMPGYAPREHWIIIEGHATPVFRGKAVPLRH